MAATRGQWGEHDPRPALMLRRQRRPYVGQSLVLLVLTGLLFGATWSLWRPPSSQRQSGPASEATVQPVFAAATANFPFDRLTGQPATLRSGTA
jgi:hypothetical protein